MDEDPNTHAAESAGAPVEYSIDELAAVSGVPSRTIRFYQSKGTLPAPERRGRVAVYGSEHRDRLQQIAELQDRGLRLDAIRDVLESLANGDDSLQAWLGVGDLLQSAWTDDEPAVISHEDLLARAGSVRPGFVADAERLGLIRRESDRRPPSYLVRSPRLLDIALRLEAAGVDLATAVGAEQILRKRMSKAADELVEWFMEHVGKGFGGTGDAESVVSAYEALQPVGIEAVQLVFAQEMERSLRSLVERGGVMRSRRKKA